MPISVEQYSLLGIVGPLSPGIFGGVAMATKKNGKMSSKEFTLKAIVSLRTEGYKGCHTVFSGFNSAYKEYFDADPVKATIAMAANGDIFSHPTRGGAMIYLPADAPSNGAAAGKAALAKMGIS